ncbi:MAG: hypothetical protein LIP03_09125 [Bacteroidales bacterium]|nr:hypothetical protein [Bacteroidales bacterium]
MKKFFTFILALAGLMALAPSAYADDDSMEDYAKLSGVYLYGKIPTEGSGWGLGLAIEGKYFMIEGNMNNGKTSGDIKKNESWSVGLGLHHRWWIGGDIFYIEGSLGPQYVHSTLEYRVETGSSSHTTPSGVTVTKHTYDTKDDGGSDFGWFITPRIGVRLYKDWCLTAGFRMESSKFKFSKDYRAEWVTVGLTVLF